MSVERLCKKLPAAIDSAKEAKDAFQVITDTAHPLKVSEWTQQAEEAKVNRIWTRGDGHIRHENDSRLVNSYWTITFRYEYSLMLQVKAKRKSIWSS